MLDLKQFRVTDVAEQGTIVELERPDNGKPLLDVGGNPYFIEVLGEDSAKVRKVDRALQDERAERQRRGKTVHDSDSLDEAVTKRLTAATIRWYLPPVDGEVLEFDEKNARRIYGDPAYSWIVDQVARAMKDRKRFFSTPSTT